MRGGGRLGALFGIVPRATSIGHGDGEHEAGRERADEAAREALGGEEEADDDRHEDGERAGDGHLLDRRRRGDGDATLVVGDDGVALLHLAVVLAVLLDGLILLVHGRAGVAILLGLLVEQVGLEHRVPAISGVHATNGQAV